MVCGFGSAKFPDTVRYTDSDRQTDRQGRRERETETETETDKRQQRERMGDSEKARERNLCSLYSLHWTGIRPLKETVTVVKTGLQMAMTAADPVRT